MKKIEFYDTTLRDGEQAPGNAISPEDKLRIAIELEKIGMHTIEAGFPISCEEDFRAVKMISSGIKSAVISAFARCLEKDIDCAHEATKEAKNKMISIFYAVSDIHLEKKYNISREGALVKIRESIQYTKKFFSNIKFGLEDATRADPVFLYQVIDLLLEEGVNSIVIADTTGWIIPSETFNLVKGIMDRVAGRAKVSMHCHNDLGMATANTLSAIVAGVDEVETTINGIGERAGNTSFEEVATALVVRKDFFQRDMQIRIKNISDLSDLVYSILGRTASFEKPVVGINAFRHEAGIHINGMKKDPTTYEILNPELIGRKREFVVGRHSGKNK
ncbi:MAG: 2-isopropylmalate synthase [Patescibacteria group bacterium]